LSAPSFDPAGILRALNDREVDYLLIGGLAVIAHGHLRATADVDIIPRPESANLERLAAALADLRAELAGVDAHLLGIALDAATLGEGANFTLTTTHGDLDVMQEVPGMSAYQALADQAVSTELDEVPVRVLALNDLIELKRAADRPLDRADVAALSEIARLDEQI
jgi:predicted nucleotidyltransferase